MQNTTEAPAAFAAADPSNLPLSDNIELMREHAAQHGYEVLLDVDPLNEDDKRPRATECISDLLYWNPETEVWCSSFNGHREHYGTLRAAYRKHPFLAVMSKIEVR